MISILTIILFFVYTWGLGYSVTYFTKKADDILERFLMNIGIGLGTLAILSIILNTLKVPLDWKLFLVLSVITPLYSVYKNIKNWKKPKLELKKSYLTTAIVLLIFLGSLYIYTRGAFNYPYLENEDPWGHSEGVKYVSLEKKAIDPTVDRGGETIDVVLSYIDPYPPAYDILLGVLHQTSPDITWTMKFFNALIVSLGFIFFFFFANEFIRDRNKALLATFILAALPSYLSHFIWAHALAVTLFLPTMYAFRRIKFDKRWMWISMIMVAGIWVSQNLEQPIKLSTMILLYLIVTSITNGQWFKKGFIALFGGMVLSLFWWLQMLQKYGLKQFVAVWQPNLVNSGEIAGEIITSASSAASPGIFSKILSVLKAITHAGGSGTRAYGLNDFLVAKSQNMINNPIGIGIVVSILTLLGVIFILLKYKSELVTAKNTWRAVALFWLIFAFWGVNGASFPFSVARGTFRVWMLLAIPTAIIATEGVWFLKSFSKNKVFKGSIILLAIIGIILTSAQQKYELNTAIWPTSSAFSSSQEAFEYGNFFETLPNNAKVFMYAPRPKIVIGFGKFSCNWCQDELDLREDIINKNAETLHRFLKEKNYEYLLLAPNMDFAQLGKKFGDDKVKILLPQRYDEILKSGLFSPVYQKENLLVGLRVI